MDIAADTDPLLDRAAALISAGRDAAAWPVLQAARDPASGRWAELAGFVQLRADRLDAAQEILDAGIAAAPADAALRRLRAEVFQRQGHLTEALGDAAESVILDRHNATAKALLGTLLLQAGQAKDALTCLAEAAAAEPSRAAFRCGLATAHEAAGDPARAAASLADAIAAIPHDLSLRNDAVLLAIRHRRFADAVAIAQDARAAGIADACLFGLLGHALSSLGRHAEAADAYQEALKLGPDDPYVRHLVAAAGIVPEAPRAPADYLRAVFDGYATRFETHLLSLGYRVPGLLRAALLRHRAVPLAPTLDLGCGTGLMGVVLSDLAPAAFTGVDLSPAMLQQARAKGLYTALHQADIVTFLRDTPAAHPIILAADVLCYFGDLAEILSLVASRLAPGGVFLASLEEAPDSHRWHLGPRGRYAHGMDYVRECLAVAGLVPRELARESLRREAGAGRRVPRLTGRSARQPPLASRAARPLRPRHGLSAGVPGRGRPRAARTRPGKPAPRSWRRCCGPDPGRGGRRMSAVAALNLLRAGDPAGALALLGDTAPDCAETAEARGMALLAAGDAAAARTELDRAIRLGGAAPALLLNRALAEDTDGDPDRARVWMHELAATYPDWAEPCLRLGESLRRAGDPAALAAYERALDRDGLRAEALVGLAVLLLGKGEADRAQTLLLRCCGLYPDNHEAWDALGQALLRQNDRMAEAAFAEAQARAPANYDYALHRVEAAGCFGNAAGELARLEVAAGTDPVSLAARGVLLERLGRRAEAIDLLEAAATLDPGAHQPALLLASLLARSPRVAEAEAALRRALQLRPDSHVLMNDLAAVLMRRHRHTEAVALLEDLRARHGDDPTCLANLATATVSLGLQREAEAHARAAIALAPDSVAPWRALTNVLPYCPGTHAADLLVALRAVSQRLPHADVDFSNSPDPSRKLRIGLLSGSLRTHPVGWLTVAGLEALDPAAFDIVCLAQNAADPGRDAMARRFRSLAIAWHDVDTLDDAALAVFARDLGLDILIDLGGYGDSGRMPACARRLAPVQIKWVGMQNHSTGLDGMDWFITDRWETPATLRALYTERLLPLADGYVCYSPPPNAPGVSPLPALANGHVTFGCFNNLAKITPETIATWSEILRAAPAARLVLKTHQFSDPPTTERVAAAFAAHGIAAGRLDFRGASPHREFMRQYNDIDIVLDPFPYAGGLTTCEALWMGVPVVTLVGELFAARHSFSHLSNVGLPDWAAFSREAYVALALAKAADLPALAELRSGLRARVKASPLCDARRFGINLGAALRHAWRDWCVRSG